MALSSTELRNAIEAIIFVSGEPVKLAELVEAFPESGEDQIKEQLGEIETRLQAGEIGFILESTAGGYRFATKPEVDPYLRRFFSKQRENRLSIAALETLAIVAYKQPITAPEISDIRGVNSSGVLRTLLERRLIRIAGRKNVVGSPFLYRTTRDFLMHFGLNAIQDLPRLEEFAEVLGENIGEDLLAGGFSETAGSEAAESETMGEAGVEGEGETIASAPETEAAATESGSEGDVEPEAQAVDEIAIPDSELQSVDEDADTVERPLEDAGEENESDRAAAAADAELENAPGEEAGGGDADVTVQKPAGPDQDGWP